MNENKNENEDKLKELIQSCDFSKVNPAHKLELRQALFTRRKKQKTDLKSNVRRSLIMANEKLIEILKDENFAKELGNAGSTEDALKLFKAKGVETSEKEIQALLHAVYKPQGGDLSEDELSAVAGGLADFHFSPNITLELFKPTLPNIPNPLDRMSELFKK